MEMLNNKRRNGLNHARVNFCQSEKISLTREGSSWNFRYYWWGWVNRKDPNYEVKAFEQISFALNTSKGSSLLIPHPPTAVATRILTPSLPPSLPLPSSLLPPPSSIFLPLSSLFLPPSSLFLPPSSLFLPPFSLLLAPPSSSPPPHAEANSSLIIGLKVIRASVKPLRRILFCISIMVWGSYINGAGG